MVHFADISEGRLVVQGETLKGPLIYYLFEGGSREGEGDSLQKELWSRFLLELSNVMRECLEGSNSSKRQQT